MIKVGYLISYDYDLLFVSLRQIYEFADKIFLAIDKDGKTWSGNDLEIPKTFFDEVQQFDYLNKIEFYYDSFYVKTLSPMENDVRERTMLSKKMGRGWLIQIDVDEYIYDFEIISSFLRKHIYLTYFPWLNPIAFTGCWVTLFKKIESGYLFIDNGEKFPLITNYAEYQYARANDNIINYSLGAIAIHQSWARSDEEMHFKINNWGHSDDFDTVKYFEFWKSLNEKNYKDFKNIHPLSPAVWDEIRFIESKNIDDFISKYSNLHPQKLTPFSFSNLLKRVLKRIVRKAIVRCQKFL